ncbi:hypothetical protein BpHYR1_052558, partial [Brachionus plicatilis]
QSNETLFLANLNLLKFLVNERSPNHFLYYNLLYLSFSSIVEFMNISFEKLMSGPNMIRSGEIEKHLHAIYFGSGYKQSNLDITKWSGLKNDFALRIKNHYNIYILKEHKILYMLILN